MPSQARSPAASRTTAARHVLSGPPPCLLSSRRSRADAHLRRYVLHCAGGLQDKVKAKTKTLNADVKAAKPTMHESMLYTNLSGCLVAGVLAAFAGHLTDGVAFCLKYPEVAPRHISERHGLLLGQHRVARAGCRRDSAAARMAAPL